MNTYTLNVINVLNSLVNDSNKNDLLAAIETIKLENTFEAKTLADDVVMLEVGKLADNSAPLYVIKLTTVKNELGLTKMESLTIDKNEMAVNEPTNEPSNKGEWGRFEIDNDSQLQEVDYDLNEYSYHSQIENQFFETVKFYVPNDEMDTVLAVINGKKYDTNFYDCEDFKKESDYLPVTFNDKVYFYYSYFYASKEYYYPTK